jgi:hypothetical protein
MSRVWKSCVLATCTGGGGSGLACTKEMSPLTVVLIAPDAAATKEFTSV